MNNLPTQLEFNVTGYGWNILRKSIYINQKPIFYKPTDLPKKNHITSFEIFPHFAEQLKDVKINYFLKDTVHLDFDYLSHKRIYLKLNADSLSLAPTQRIVGNIIFEPEYITVSGPAKEIKKISDTFNLKLNEEEIQGSYEEVVPVNAFDEGPLKASHNEVLVKFDTKVFKVITNKFKINKRNFPRRYKLSEDSVMVKFYYNDIPFKTDEVVVEADYQKRKGNIVALNLVGLPEGFRDFELEEPYVKIIR